MIILNYPAITGLCYCIGTTAKKVNTIIVPVFNISASSIRTLGVSNCSLLLEWQRQIWSGNLRIYARKTKKHDWQTGRLKSVWWCCECCCYRNIWEQKGENIRCSQQSLFSPVTSIMGRMWAMHYRLRNVWRKTRTFCFNDQWWYLPPTAKQLQESSITRNHPSRGRKKIIGHLFCLSHSERDVSPLWRSTPRSHKWCWKTIETHQMKSFLLLV